MKTLSKTFTSVKNGDTITINVPEAHILDAARIFLKGRDSEGHTYYQAEKAQSTTETSFYTQAIDINSLSVPENAIWKPPHRVSNHVVGKGEAIAGGDPQYTYHLVASVIYNQADTGSYRGETWVAGYGTQANQLDCYIIPGSSGAPIYASKVTYVAQEWPGVTFSLNEIVMELEVWAKYVLRTKGVSVFLDGGKVAEHVELLANGQMTSASVFSGLNVGTNNFKVYTLNNETIVDVIIEYDYTEKAFPDLGLKINNQLKTSEAGWVKVDGQLKEIQGIWVKINGQLKEE